MSIGRCFSVHVITRVQDLLAAGANVDATDIEGRTSLHKSTRFGHLESVQVSIRYHSSSIRPLLFLGSPGSRRECRRRRQPRTDITLPGIVWWTLANRDSESLRFVYHLNLFCRVSFSPEHQSRLPQMMERHHWTSFAVHLTPSVPILRVPSLLSC